MNMHEMPVCTDSKYSPGSISSRTLSRHQSDNVNFTFSLIFVSLSSRLIIVQMLVA